MTESLLPNIIVNIDITLNKNQLKKKLKETILSLGCIDSQKDTDISFTVIKKDKNVLKNICSALFNNNNQITSIQVFIRSLENRYDRLLEIKQISGNQNDGEYIISQFLKKIVKFSKNVKIIKNTSGFFINLGEELNNIINGQTNELYNSINLVKNDEQSTMLENINKEATNYYEIYKILTQENYELGKSVNIFINEFKIKNENIEESSKILPKQMKEIILMIRTCEDTFFNYFNFGKQKNKNENLLSYINPAIEKFLFNKLYFQLYELYAKKYNQENEDYLNKKKLINENYSIEDIMNFLEIKEKFRLLDDYKKSEFSENFKPYKSTIDHINKIEYEQNPKVKFDTILSAGLDMRNTILGGNFGKVELNSMDDELPIFIYICTQINLKNAPAEFSMIEDYLKFSSSDEGESKVLTNIQSSLTFIRNGWEINNK
jgi:hypothetical protein